MLGAIGPMISAASSLIGGFIGRDAQKDQQQANAALQREFAQNAIQWKVADAKKAGVHPLFAMGAPTISPAVSMAADPMGAAVASMGQDISRAMASGGGNKQETALAGQMAALGLERAQLQNDLLRSQIARINQGAGPGLPIPSQNVVPGQANSNGLVQIKPGQSEAASPTAAGQAAVVVPDVAWTRTDTGLAPVPSKSVKEQIEDITIPQLMWGFRNNVMPNIGRGAYPQADPGPGKMWVWNYAMQEYQAYDRDSWYAKMFGRRSK